MDDIGAPMYPSGNMREESEEMYFHLSRWHDSTNVRLKAHSCENVTEPVTFFQKMSYRGYILFRIHFHSNFF